MHWLVKIIFWSFIIGGLALLVIDPVLLPEFYNPGYMAASAFLSALGIYSPLLFFRSKKPQKKDAVTRFQLAISAAVALNALGALGLYRLDVFEFGYDKLVHLFVPMILVSAITEFRIKWLNQDSRSALQWSSLMIVFGIFIWEGWEFFSDNVFGTSTLGNYGQNIVADTAMDITISILGVVAASILLSLRKKERQ